jgi:hypothetical protein
MDHGLESHPGLAGWSWLLSKCPLPLPSTNCLLTFNNTGINGDISFPITALGYFFI